MGSKGKNGAAPKGASWKTPVAGILLAGGALLSLLALWSYRPRGASENWAGPVGHSVAGTLLEATGFGGYALALFLLAVACALLLGRPRLSFARAGSWLLFSFCAMGLLDLLVHVRVQGHPAGGAVGSMLAGTARAALSVPGAAVLLCAVAGAALVVATDLWALHAARGAAKLGVAGGALAVRGAAAAFNKARTVSFGDQEDFFAGDDGRIVEPSRPAASKAALALAAAAAQEPLQDPREAMPVGEDKGRRKKELSQPDGALQPPGAHGPLEPRLDSAPPPQIVEPKAPPKANGAVAQEQRSADPAGSFT
ncbi:MAG TPA: DNA translocase FtsK 4TM domain-containing protein, partial [Myxococcales bacterium]|nr:DNA translocase FtsK 4TM domain-containing protein [Myxococcales bacterium]